MMGADALNGYNETEQIPAAIIKEDADKIAAEEREAKAREIIENLKKETPEQKITFKITILENSINILKIQNSELMKELKTMHSKIDALTRRK